MLKLQRRKNPEAVRAALKKTTLTFAVPAALVASVAPAVAQTQAAELRILSPRIGDAISTESFALDVSFRSKTPSPIVTAELWVDGTRWIRRDLDAPQFKNVLSFDVDAASLSPGNHTFIIRVFDADGGTAEKKTTLRIAARPNILPAQDAPATEMTTSGGPDMKFLSPQKDQRVSGVVELLLETQSRNGANPYVTFYVDKQFKTLKNYPPYSYAWDTTTVPNGYHTIEATGYLEATNASASRRLRVLVDNPGGNTRRMDEVPDLAKAREMVPTTAASLAKPVAIPISRTETRKLEAIARKAASQVVLGLSALPKTLTPDVTTEVQERSERATPVAPAVKPVTRPRLARPASSPVAKTTVSVTDATPSALTRPVTVASLSPATTDAVAASIAETLNRTEIVTADVVRAAKPVKAARRAMTPVTGLNVAAPKSTVLFAAPVAVRATAAKPSQEMLVPLAIPKKTTRATPRAIVRPQLPAILDLMNAKPLQVAFNGRRVVFDVQPRVEKGLPITPFRQIFQHTGGDVQWLHQTKVLRAINADREIVISVGKKNARVNGETMTMERAARLERGRTLVPLSFVKQALDVNVDFDPATGRIHITTKE